MAAVAALPLREALLRALAVDPKGRPRQGASLLRDDPQESILLLPTGDWVIFRSLEGGDQVSQVRLEARLAELQSAIRTPVSLVVVGGEGPLRGVVPRFGLGNRVALFHVSLEGRLRGGGLLSRPARTVGPMLRVALGRLAGEGVFDGARLRSLTEEERDALLHAGEALRRAQGEGEEATFWSRLYSVTPWATHLLTGSIALVFLLESFWGGSDFTPTLYRMGANVPERVRAGEFYRLFAAAFLHIGIVHLLVNLWALRVFGIFLERVLGTAAFLVLYALSALAGSVASVSLGTARLSAGASGALWGLMVGGFALSFWGPIPEGLRRRIRASGWQPILVNLIISFTPGIAISAHMGGGLAGGALVLAGTLIAPRVGPAARRWIAPAAAVLTLLMVVSFAAALVTGRPWELKSPAEPWDTVGVPGTAISVEVPRGFGVPRRAAEGGYLLGELPRDPVQAVLTFAETTPVEESQALAAGLAHALEGEPPLEGATPVGPAEPLLLNGRPAARRSYELPGGASRTTWLTETPDLAVRVEVIALRGAAPAWIAIGERIAGSIKGHLSPRAR
jgi:rhomboid protease GluP